MFVHDRRQIRVVIHGDDFTILGSSENLDWFRSKMEEIFEIKVRARLGPARGDDKADRLLNRVFTWTGEGIIVEGDQRHAEIICDQAGVKEGSKAATTPGEKIREDEETRGKGETEMNN